MKSPVVLPTDFLQRLSRARELHHQGCLDEAGAIYREILSCEPEQGDALYLSGLVCYQQEKPEAALEYLEKAVRLAPENGMAWVNLAEVYRSVGKLEKGEQAAREAIFLLPKSSEAHNNLGAILKARARLKKAEDSLQTALHINAKSINALINMGSICHTRGEYEEALEWYARALAQDHNNPSAQHNLGSTLMELGRFDEAKSALHKALHGKNDMVAALNSLGKLYRHKREFGRAVELLQRARELQPDKIGVALNLAFVWLDIGKTEKGIALLEQAVITAPENVTLLNGMVHLYSVVGDTAKARTIIDSILQLKTDDTEALCSLANIYLIEGKLKQARRQCQRVIAVNEQYATAYYLLSSLLAADECREAAEKIEAVLAGKKQSLFARIQLYFGLGTVAERAGMYSRAFTAFQEGNRLKRSSFQYKFAEQQAVTDSLIATYTTDFIEERQTRGSRSGLPVFIMGMPRSGTTLVEQILSAHNQVFGAGELMLLVNVMAEFAGMKSPDELPFSADFLKVNRLREYGDRVAHELQKLSPPARRIIDKMPGNFLNIGMIKLILPNARIIHCRRNPPDTCLSIFKTLFTTGHEYAYNLDDIAGYYQLYEKIMAHWHTSFPGEILDIHLDDLIDDQEIITRKLVRYCGLEWDSNCLDFQNNHRQVLTASMVRVRQPLKSSSGLWRRYGDRLKPLRDALEKG